MYELSGGLPKSGYSLHENLILLCCFRNTITIELFAKMESTNMQREERYNDRTDIRAGLPPIVVPKRELVNADFRHENLCYCLAVS